MGYKQLKEFRNKRKNLLIAAFGGKCQVCAYNKARTALEFHHINPNEKEFGFSTTKNSYNQAQIIAEAKKCVMVCANCHREIHDGLLECPKSSFDENIFLDQGQKIVDFASCKRCGKETKNKNFCSYSCAASKITWDEEKLLELYDAGTSLLQISKLFNVSDVAVAKKLKKLGVFKKSK